MRLRVSGRAFALAASAAGALLLACVGDSPKLPSTPCDGMDTYCNNACTSTQTDPRNCGACGKTCNTQAGEVCQVGVCGPPCTGGTKRCTIADAGVCSDVQNDPQNCGDCAKKCASTESCVMGQCAVVCQMGLTSCPRSGAPTDGGVAEGGASDAGVPSSNACVDTNTHALNCGKCGTVCPQEKPFCDAGQCKIYKFAGVLTNVSQDDLASAWKECFVETYGTTGTSVANILTSKCTQANLMLGCRLAQTKTLIAVAEAPRIDVTFDTGFPPPYGAPINAGTFHLANGTAWYYNVSAPCGANCTSWGFAAAGDTLNKYACDTATGLAPEKRLCWHASSNQLNAGYRCGTNINLQSGGMYERLILQAP